MLTITTRQLKQNPAQAISAVLNAGQAAVITSYGTPTGAVIAPSRPMRRQWVSGGAIMSHVTPMSDDECNSWKTELAEHRDSEFGRDLWGAR